MRWFNRRRVFQRWFIEDAPWDAKREIAGSANLCIIQWLRSVELAIPTQAEQSARNEFVAYQSKLLAVVFAVTTFWRVQLKKAINSDLINVINFSPGIGVIQLCNPSDKKNVPTVEFRWRQERRSNFFTWEISLFPRFERVKILKHFAKIKLKGRGAAKTFSHAKDSQLFSAENVFEKGASELVHFSFESSQGCVCMGISSSWLKWNKSSFLKGTKANKKYHRRGWLCEGKRLLLRAYF